MALINGYKIIRCYVFTYSLLTVRNLVGVADCYKVLEGRLQTTNTTAHIFWIVFLFPVWNGKMYFFGLRKSIQ
jgi:hypothetical protein